MFDLIQNSTNFQCSSNSYAELTINTVGTWVKTVVREGSVLNEGRIDQPHLSRVFK